MDLQADLMRYMQNDIGSMPKELLVAVKRFPHSPGISIRNYLTSFLGNATICNYIVRSKVHSCYHIFYFCDKILKDIFFLGFQMLKHW